MHRCLSALRRSEQLPREGQNLLLVRWQRQLPRQLPGDLRQRAEQHAVNGFGAAMVPTSALGDVLTSHCSARSVRRTVRSRLTQSAHHWRRDRLGAASSTSTVARPTTQPCAGSRRASGVPGGALAADGHWSGRADLNRRLPGPEAPRARHCLTATTRRLARAIAWPREVRRAHWPAFPERAEDTGGGHCRGRRACHGASG